MKNNINNSIPKSNTIKTLFGTLFPKGKSLVSQTEDDMKNVLNSNEPIVEQKIDPEEVLTVTEDEFKRVTSHQSTNLPIMINNHRIFTTVTVKQYPELSNEGDPLFV